MVFGGRSNRPLAKMSTSSITALLLTQRVSFGRHSGRHPRRVSPQHPIIQHRKRLRLSRLDSSNALPMQQVGISALTSPTSRVRGPARASSTAGKTKKAGRPSSTSTHRLRHRCPCNYASFACPSNRRTESPLVLHFGLLSKQPRKRSVAQTTTTRLFLSDYRRLNQA